ncbi:MAG: hemerythrin domain-containing protein [Planctomycetota bacterium]
MEDPSSNGLCTHPAEFAVWSQAAKLPIEEREDQPPAEELLGEHHLMNLVTNAMEAEALRLQQGEEMRTEFWAEVVDFIGNFVHVCHRQKEEEVFYPAVLRGGIIEKRRSDALEHEHENAKKLTLGICEGVEMGDWERVLRLVTMYVHFMRHHMRSEEQELMQPFMGELEDNLSGKLLGAFREVEVKALDGRDRQHYLGVARRLCETAGVPHGFDDGSA